MKKQIPLWVVLAFGLIIIVGSGFTGNYFYRQLENELNSQIETKEEELKQSRKKVDSLNDLSDEYKSTADELRNTANRLQTVNNNLYYELQKRKKNAFVLDSDFVSNAKRIAESSNRFYKENDTIR